MRGWPNICTSPVAMKSLWKFWIWKLLSFLQRYEAAKHHCTPDPLLLALSCTSRFTCQQCTSGLMLALGTNGKVDCVNFYTELGWCTLAFPSNMFAVCRCNPLPCFCGWLIEHFAQVMDLSLDQEKKPDFEFMDKDDMLLLMDKSPHQKSANSK